IGASRATERQRAGAAMTGVADLIDAAQTNPAKPVLQGLLNESEIAGLHGPPASFKTIFTLQLAESLALGAPFLSVWPVCKARTVFFFETEMSTDSLGRRLAKMYPRGAAAPAGIHLADETQLHKFRRAANLQVKFSLLNVWLREAHVDVVILDTV